MENTINGSDKLDNWIRTGIVSTILLFLLLVGVGIFRSVIDQFMLDENPKLTADVTKMASDIPKLQDIKQWEISCELLGSVAWQRVVTKGGTEIKRRIGSGYNCNDVLSVYRVTRDGPVLRVYTYGYERKNTFDHRFPEKLIKDAEQLMSSEEEDREKNRKIESSWTVKE